MKVLHVGDINGLSFNLVSLLRKHGVDAFLFVPEGYTPTGMRGLTEDKPDWILTGQLGLKSLLPRLAKMREFDILQPCGMSIAYAWLAGRPTTPYSMGSDLRKVAFEKSLTGLAMRTGFRKSKAVFFSNADQLQAIKKLDLNCVFLPQALPELMPPKKRLGERFTVFCPSRLDWSTSAKKGNDLLIKAFTMLPKRISKKTRLLLTDWGANKEDAKKMVADLGLKNVEFVRFMQKEELYSYYATANLVADQFAVKSFGMALLEAMLTGTPVMSAVDNEYERLYGEKTPILNAGTAEEIAEKVTWAFENQDELKKLGNKTREWLLRNHDGKRIAGIAKKTYAAALEC